MILAIGTKHRGHTLTIFGERYVANHYAPPMRSAEPTEYTPVNLTRAVVEVKDLVSLRKT